MRIYHRPHEVLRDRRLSDLDRLEILSAWQRDETASADQLAEIGRARDEIEARLPHQRAAE